MGRLPIVRRSKLSNTEQDDEKWFGLTIDQVIAQLTQLRDAHGGDTPCVMSKDGEGNGFSPLFEADIAMYAAESTYAGDRYMTEADRLAADDPDEYTEAPDDAVKAVFLWPTN